MVSKIATGEIEDVRPTPESEGKDSAAALGKKGGLTDKVMDMADVVKLIDEYEASRKEMAA